MTDTRRRLPAVNTLLDRATRAGLLDQAPRQVVVEVIRATLADARAHGGGEPADGWLHELEQRVAERSGRSLVRVINATGVVLHTNLGRAPLATAAREAMAEAAGYAALEFDLDTGRRGSRHDHTRRLIAGLTGADDAVVVNNAASALVLTLQALAGGGETIVSRGELIEIGGSFRIPEILAQSGTVLVEAGSTNRTRLRDYEQALGARTRCLLKMHRSNFRMTGFVSEVEVEDLRLLAVPRGLPVVHDVGSGLLLDLADAGLTGEPLVAPSVAAGALTIFSGDKLLGGPQAGLIAGPAALVRRLTEHPLARALRPDKTILAALEATLLLYRDPERARREIPVLAMLTESAEALDRRARRLVRRVPGAATEAGSSVVGGGAFPDAVLPTTLVAVPTDDPEALVTALRAGDPPIIARASEGRVLFDVRTFCDGDLPVVADALAARLTSSSED